MPHTLECRPVELPGGARRNVEEDDTFVPIVHGRPPLDRVVTWMQRAP
jgi:hypothetical protein